MRWDAKCRIPLNLRRLTRAFPSYLRHGDHDLSHLVEVSPRDFCGRSAGMRRSGTDYVHDHEATRRESQLPEACLRFDGTGHKYSGSSLLSCSFVIIEIIGVTESSRSGIGSAVVVAS
jgi:hypothetical protein